MKTITFKPPRDVNGDILMLFGINMTSHTCHELLHLIEMSSKLYEHLKLVICYKDVSWMEMFIQYIEADGQRWGELATYSDSESKPLA